MITAARICILLKIVHSNGRLINENMHQYKNRLYLKHKSDTAFKLETTILCIQGLYGLAIDLNKDPILLKHKWHTTVYAKKVFFPPYS